MNNIQVFHNAQFGQIRTAVTESGEPLVAAVDVARALGYANPQEAIRTHCKGVSEILTPTTNQHGAVVEQQMKFISEYDVYRLVMRSKLPQAEKFQDWACEEVFPSIRKHGGYLTPEKVEEVLLNPDTIIQLATQLKDERAKRIEAEKRVKTLAPKAEFLDRVLDTDEKIDVGQAAKILGLPFGRNTLFSKLREKGIFFTNRNEPKQAYIERGYFELKEKWIDRNSHDGFMVVKVLVTQRGLAFIGNQFQTEPRGKKLAKIV